jgi:hypothetical protein
MGGTRKILRHRDATPRGALDQQNVHGLLPLAPRVARRYRLSMDLTPGDSGGPDIGQ